MKKSKAKVNNPKSNHPLVHYVEVGSDTPILFKGETFYWINSTDCDRAVAMCDPNPLTDSIYVVLAHSRTEATVLQCPPPPGDPEEPPSAEDDYTYETTGSCCDCEDLHNQPKVKIGR
jgi:hypothetical protein